MTEPSNNREAYWKQNIKYLGILLSIWFLVSYVFGILLAEPLNSVKFMGFPMGFWWAQQGSIYVFVILIVIYVKLMNKLDAQYGLDE